MIWFDRVVATLAMAAFAGYLGILIWHVPKFGLVAVSVIVVGMGVFDFGRILFGHHVARRSGRKVRF
jgi:hypothetical protein